MRNDLTNMQVVRVVPQLLNRCCKDYRRCADRGLPVTDLWPRWLLNLTFAIIWDSSCPVVGENSLCAYILNCLQLLLSSSLSQKTPSWTVGVRTLSKFLKAFISYTYSNLPYLTKINTTQLLRIIGILLGGTDTQETALLRTLKLCWLCVNNDPVHSALPGSHTHTHTGFTILLKRKSSCVPVCVCVYQNIFKKLCFSKLWDDKWNKWRRLLQQQLVSESLKRVTARRHHAALFTQPGC